MNQEILKKIVELADGFEWEEIRFSDTGNITAKVMRTTYPGTYEPGDNILIGILQKWKLYPLILRRAVEGFNRECKNVDNLIYIYEENLCSDKCFYYRGYQKTDYLTPQEQAIEVCLIELLEAK